jgi:hypothetical protein
MISETNGMVHWLFFPKGGTGMTGGVGEVTVTGKKVVYVRMQAIKHEKTPGDPVEQIELKGPAVHLTFESESTIDILIKKLNEAKDALRVPCGSTQEGEE